MINHKLPLCHSHRSEYCTFSPSPTCSLSSALTFSTPVSLFTCLLLWPLQSPHTAHLSICTLTLFLQTELISGDSNRLTLMTLQNRKVNWDQLVPAYFSAPSAVQYQSNTHRQNWHCNELSTVLRKCVFIEHVHTFPDHMYCTAYQCQRLIVIFWIYTSFYK